MNVVFFLPMFLAGFVLKIIDDIFDNGILTKNIGLLLSILATPLGIWLMLDAEGFILVGAIFWTTLFRGKIDNIGFKLGYLLTAAIWGLLYFVLTPFPMSVEVLGSLFICILSIILTTVFHDIFKKKDTLLWTFFIEERFMIALLDTPCILLGVVDILGILGIFLLVLGYSLGGKVAHVIDEKSIRKNVIYTE